jgi:hypothetical protein
MLKRAPLRTVDWLGAQVHHDTLPTCGAPTRQACHQESIACRNSDAVHGVTAFPGSARVPNGLRSARRTPALMARWLRVEWVITPPDDDGVLAASPGPTGQGTSGGTPARVSTARHRGICRSHRRRRVRYGRGGAAPTSLGHPIVDADDALLADDVGIAHWSGAAGMHRRQARVGLHYVTRVYV